MMFNMFFCRPDLFLLSLASCFFIFMISQCIRRPFFKILFHIFICISLLIAAIGGGGVQNDGYERLEKFIELEQNNQLDEAKKNPQYGSMLQIDLKEFKNSDEFRKYLQEHDRNVDRAEAIAVGYLYALVAQISLLGLLLIKRIL